VTQEVDSSRQFVIVLDEEEAMAVGVEGAEGPIKGCEFQVHVDGDQGGGPGQLTEALIDTPVIH